MIPLLLLYNLTVFPSTLSSPIYRKVKHIVLDPTKSELVYFQVKHIVPDPADFKSIYSQVKHPSGVDNNSSSNSSGTSPDFQCAKNRGLTKINPVYI